MATNTSTNSKAQNPFLDNDFSKMFSQVKMPGMDIEAIVANSRKNAEAWTAANQAYVEGMQKFLQDQSAFARKMLEESASESRDLMNADADPAERLIQITDTLKGSFEKSVNNAQKAAKMIEKIQSDVNGLLQKRANESYSEMKKTLKEASSK